MREITNKKDNKHGAQRYKGTGIQTAYVRSYITKQRRPYRHGGYKVYETKVSSLLKTKPSSQFVKPIHYSVIVLGKV